MKYRKMGNGKHRGKPINEIPFNYLQWWANNYINTKSYKSLAQYILDYIQPQIDQKIEDVYKLGMPFGKYKGQAWDNIPSNYLKYLLDNGMSDKIIQEVFNKVLEDRKEIQSSADKQEELNQQIKEQKKKDQHEIDLNSEWIGDIGDLIEEEVMLEHQFGYDGQYGPGNMKLFRTRDGNILIMSGSYNMKDELESIGIKMKELFMMSFKVKDFSIRNSIKQTRIGKPIKIL